MIWATLRQNIEQYFNEEELRALCFDLGVDYESLGGRGKAAHVTELVALFQRNGRYSDLLAQLTHLRWAVAWEIPHTLPTATQMISGPAPVPETAAERRIRNDLLQKVKSNWIQGVLEKSLHNILRLDLGFTYKPEAVARSWSMTLQQPDMQEQDLPENISILDVFRQHQRELLILGEPGAGKTITLLELARDLIVLAETDETQPLPVVLNLSPWADKRLPFAIWLEEALLHEYQVSQKVGKKWVATDYQLTLLLDGLDEVQTEHREACVAAINNFRADHLADIVICSRVADYEDLHTRANISTAVMLRPLTLEQIETYLTAGGQSLAALHQTLQADATFQALAQTPLLLSIMAMTYRNQPVSTFQDHSRPVEQRRHLFNHYVQYMFTHQHMALRTQSSFSSDILQTTWLPTKTAQYAYVILVGVFYWFITTLVIGIISSSFELGAVIGIFIGYMGIHTAQNKGIGKIALRERMSVIEIPLKSHRKMLHVLVIGLGIGIVGLLNTTLIWCITIGAVTGVVYWLILSRKDVRFFLSQGISRRNLPRILNYITPNIGIGVCIGLAGYSIGKLAWSPIQNILLGMFFSLMLWIALQLLIILGVPLIVLVAYTDSHVRHHVLRALLALTNTLPWQPNHFLDEMVACGFLRKSGKSFLFVHTLLRDHFADSALENGLLSLELSRFDVDILWKTAKIHREQKQFDQALLCLNRAIELQPKWAGLFQDRGLTYREMEEYTMARADLNRAIELNPKAAWHFQGRGLTYHAMKEYTLALSDFNRAIELQPNVVWLVRDRGRTYREIEEYTSALADFNRAIELEPEWAVLFQDRGRTYHEMAEYPLALADFNRAIKLEPKWAGLWGHRGRIYRDMEEYALALADFNRAIELQPKWGGLFQGRGLTYYEMEEYPLALADFNRAIELEPEWAVLFQDRGRTYRLMGVYASALADLSQAVEMEPKVAWLFWDRGLTYREMEEYASALANFSHAIVLEPKWPRLFHDRGITYLLLSHSAKAETDFQTAIALGKRGYERHPGNWGKSLPLAFYYLVANNEIEAQNIYQSAHVAPTHFIKRAIKRLNEFLAIFPNHSQAQAMHQLLQEYLHSMDSPDFMRK